MPKTPTGRPTGRPPQPVEQKRRRGNPGKRPLPEAQIVISAPLPLTHEAPSDLDAAGRQMWEDGLSVAQAWLIHGTDKTTLYIACKLWDEIHRFRAILEEKGLTHLRPIVLPNGQLAGAESVPNPIIKELRAAETQLRTHLSTLGFDPTSRARLGHVEVRRQTELEELMARRSERQAARALPRSAA